MDEQRWRRVEELFHAALEQEPQARQPFLDRSCDGDIELRRQVELLLAKADEAGSFLETTTIPEFAPAGALPGRQFGPYRIVSPIGAGGMGEVYRAHDSKLGRDVAIKFLPPEFARDPERLARFRREARVLASLNHPNIAAIYGLEESDDADCLVLELVEGDTLRGPLPIKRALFFARQIADALEAAHSKGIVHRDLKPDNLKVTPEGRVKVLDFGLAKAGLGVEAKPDPTRTEAETGVDTRAGHIVGTPGYMSPEQARGEVVDNRTDIWAFGCVLYELLTGKRPFQGTTAAEIIHAALHQDPDWQAVPAKTPAKITRLLRQCLQKGASQRLHSIALVRIAIENEQTGRSGWRLAAAGLAMLVVGAAALVLWQLRHGGDVPQAPTITRVTTDSGLTAYPALSPDGRFLAYASDRASDGNLNIWMQQTDGGNPLRLTNDAFDNSEPCFSPDGARIVFRSEREGGGVYVVPSLGGPAQRIADLGRSPRFSPDGKWIAYWTGDLSYYGRRRTFVIPAAGGEPREIQPSFFFATHPVWSPDSKRLLFRGGRIAESDPYGRFDWWITPLEGGKAIETGASELLQQSKLAAMERSQLITGFGIDPGDWSSDAIVFSASAGSAGLSGSLWRVRLSSRYRAEGPVQRIMSGTENQLQPSAAGAHMAFATLTQNENIWSLPLDPKTGKAKGGLQRVTSNAAADVLPVLSVNGNKLAFASNRTGTLHLWIKDLETGTETALTSSTSNELPWLISPDGSKVVYCVVDNTARGCFIIPAAGGVARGFCGDCGASSIQDWVEGGRKVLYKKGGLGASTQLMLRDVDSGRETVFLSHPKYGATAARFSPDGRWVSFQIVIDAATRRQIFVAPVRGGVAAGEQEWVPITGGSGLDRNAVWSPGGDLLYFLSERDGYRCIWAQGLDKVTKRAAGPPVAVYHFHQARRSLMPAQEVVRIGLSVARDKLIFSMAETNGNIWFASFE